MFKIGQTVKRNPKIWRNDKVKLKVIGFKGKAIMTQQAGKTRNFFTGEMEAHQPMPYLAQELVAI